MRNVAMHHGYSQGVTVQASNGVTVEDTVLWRSMLPAFQIIPGALTLGGPGVDPEGTVLARNVAVSGIYWETHRGGSAEMSARLKLDPMIGMFHDEGVNSILHGNVAAGSERAGFSGAGVACGDYTSFVANEVLPSVALYSFLRLSDHSRILVVHSFFGPCSQALRCIPSCSV